MRKLANRRSSARAPSSPASTCSTALKRRPRSEYPPSAPILLAATRDPGFAWLRAARGEECRAPIPPCALPRRATEPYRPIPCEATTLRARTAGPPANRVGGQISCDEAGSAGTQALDRRRWSSFRHARPRAPTLLPRESPATRTRHAGGGWRALGPPARSPAASGAPPRPALSTGLDEVTPPLAHAPTVKIDCGDERELIVTPRPRRQHRRFSRSSTSSAHECDAQLVAVTHGRLGPRARLLDRVVRPIGDQRIVPLETASHAALLPTRGGSADASDGSAPLSASAKSGAKRLAGRALDDARRAGGRHGAALAKARPRNVTGRDVPEERHKRLSTAIAARQWRPRAN